MLLDPVVWKPELLHMELSDVDDGELAGEVLLLLPLCPPSSLVGRGLACWLRATGARRALSVGL